MRLNIKNNSNFKLYNNSEFNVYKAPEDYLIFHDIRDDQSQTIGELHYDSLALNPLMTTVFTGQGGYKVVTNQNQYGNNRINYYLEDIPDIFTAVFDYRAYRDDGLGGNGGYFYFYAPGEISPNDGISCPFYDPEYDQTFNAACDSFPLGKYSSPTEGSYRVHFEEHAQNQDPQLAITWNGYIGENLYDRFTVCQTEPTDQYPLGFTFDDGVWRTIKIQFNSGNFKIFIDDFLRLDCTDIFFNYRNKEPKNLGLGGYVTDNSNFHSFKNFKLYSKIV